MNFDESAKMNEFRQDGSLGLRRGRGAKCGFNMGRIGSCRDRMVNAHVERRIQTLAPSLSCTQP